MRFLLFILLLNTAWSIAQDSTKTKQNILFEIQYAPKNFPLNKSKLIYAPSNDYGSQFLHTTEIGGRIDLGLSDRFWLSARGYKNTLFLEWYYTNPTPTGTVDENLSSISNIQLFGYSFGFGAKYYLYKSRFFRLGSQLDLRFSQYLGSETIRTSTYSDGLGGTYELQHTEIEKFGSTNHNWIFIWPSGGFRFEFPINKWMHLAFETNLVYGKSKIRYFHVKTPDGEVKKLEFNFPIGIGFRFE